MNQKNETPVTAKTKPEAESQSVSAKATKPSTPTAEPLSETAAAKPQHGDVGSLSPEVIDLITELRDTVKSLNPRRHTAKTLRRSLSLVSAILADIEKLLPQG